MNNAKKLLIACIMLVAFVGYVFANQLTTTMTWYIPSAKSHSIDYGGNCNGITFFFPEDEADATVGDPDVDGNASKILPYDARSSGNACQAEGTAGMVITNNGTITTNIDANFAAGQFDTNCWVKVWQGTGAGCGGSGFGGWEFICSLSDSVNSPVTQTQCKDFNSGNAIVGTRLVTNLAKGDTNQLCFSGALRGQHLYEFPADVAGGDQNATWRTSTDFS